MTGVQTCALPISKAGTVEVKDRRSGAKQEATIDAAIARRLRKIPFDSDVRLIAPGGQLDTGFHERMLAQRDAIFSLFLAHAVEWYQHRLSYGEYPTPESIKAEVTDWITDEDPLGQFKMQCLIIEPNVVSTSAALYKAYCDWVKAQGTGLPLPAGRFHRMLSGVRSVRVSMPQGDGTTKQVRARECLIRWDQVPLHWDEHNNAVPASAPHAQGLPGGHVL